MTLAARAARPRWAARLDWALVAPVGLLVGVGLLMIWSSTRAWVAGTGGDPLYYVRRQLLSLAVGVGGATALVVVDYRWWARRAGLWYAVANGLLVAVLVVGRRVAGTQGWLPLGPLPALQPAEFAKLALIIALAAHLAGRSAPRRGADLLVPLMLTGLSLGLVLLQPDLGTALVFGVILLGMLYIARAPIAYLLWIVAGAAGAAAVALGLSWLGWLPLLSPHQVDRLVVFVNPGAHIQGAGWNVAQSVIAIGSGRFFGHGLFRGPQTQLAFVPARHTDFIFSTVGEELGFLGAAAVLGLYAILLRRSVATAMSARDRLGTLLVGGVVVMLAFHVIWNGAMTVGIVPVTGIPLPLLSYGGSSLVTTLMGLALVLNVGSRRLIMR